MKITCKLCTTELSNFIHAKEYRRVGYCPKHIPKRLTCEYPSCNRPAKHNKLYCHSHRNPNKRKPKGTKVRCKGITVNHKQCCNLVSSPSGLCKVHRKQKQKRLTAKDYSKYIQSSEWAKKSEAIRSEYGNRCRLCNRTGLLHAHHRTYKRLGIEHPNDLTPLCKDCHDLFGKHYTYDSKSHTFKPNK